MCLGTSAAISVTTRHREKTTRAISTADAIRIRPVNGPAITTPAAVNTNAAGASRAAPYHLLAELQLRLGLRRGEVLALESDWLDEAEGRVTVPCNARFAPKSRQARVVDGVDPETFHLARVAVEAKAALCVTEAGYKMALRRACARWLRPDDPGGSGTSRTPFEARTQRGASTLACRWTLYRDGSVTRASASRNVITSGERTIRRRYRSRVFRSSRSTRPALRQLPRGSAAYPPHYPMGCSAHARPATERE